jgi:hypothetical protein
VARAATLGRSPAAEFFDVDYVLRAAIVSPHAEH